MTAFAAYTAALLSVAFAGALPDGECLRLDRDRSVSLRFLGPWPPELERSVRDELELELGARPCRVPQVILTPLRIGWSAAAVLVRVGDAVEGKVRRIERSGLPAPRLAFAVAMVARELVRAEAVSIAPTQVQASEPPASTPSGRRSLGVTAASGLLFVESNPPALDVNVAFLHRPNETWSWTLGVVARRVGAERGTADLRATELGVNAGLDLRVAEVGPLAVRIGANVELGAIFAEAERGSALESQTGGVGTGAGRFTFELPLGSDFALWLSAKAGSYLLAPRIQIGQEEGEAFGFEGLMWGTNLGLTWLP